jgi:hypothetical protein
MTCPECRAATPIVWEYARVDEDCVDPWLAEGWEPFAAFPEEWVSVRDDEQHWEVRVCLRRVKPEPAKETT